MSNQPFQISQGFEILQPKSGKAYPVPCEEWDYLKAKIEKITFSNDNYNNGGWALIGVALSTLGSILLGTFSSTALIIACAIVTVSLIAGALCLYFSEQMKKFKKTNASDIIQQMEIIEKRYQQDAALG